MTARRLPAAIPLTATLALVIGATTAGVRTQPHGTTAAAAGLTVPAGFEVEMVAGPPLVDRPIVADFDEEGRLYVADSSGSNARVDVQLAERPHRIVRLEDTDDDGRFDRSVVFADRMMFPEGTLWHAGSLYVSAPPSIWKLTDTDGDGVADRREEWFQGKTLTGCANDLHGPYLGPDGWFYWTKGAFAEQTYARAGRPSLVTRAAHILRRRPSGGEVDVVMTGGMDNPVDVAFTPAGERILTATFLEHPQQGRRDALVHAVYGGLYGKPHGVIDGHVRTGDLMPGMTHLGPAVPSGLTRYTSEAFGPEYRDSFFAAMFNLRKVTRHVLEPDGATYRTRDSDFLVSSSRDFHPTDVIEDADGTLLVVDTGPWYKLCCPTSQLAKPDLPGAIYRVKRAGAAAPADARGRSLSWSTLGPPQLAALLADPRAAVRARAIELLGRGGDQAAAALEDLLRSPGSAAARREAVWALSRIETAGARAAVRVALADLDESVRHAAAHVAGLHRDGDAAPGLVNLLSGGSPGLQRAAAEAIGRVGDRTAVPALLAAAGAASGRVAAHSLTYALIEIGDVALTAAGLRAPSPATRRAALLALDQMPGNPLTPGDVLPIIESAEPALADTAWWIVERHPAWGRELVPYIRAELSSELAPAQQKELGERLARIAGHDGVAEVLAMAVASPLASVRTAALHAMAGATLRELPAGWSAALESVLERGSVEDARAALRALRSPSLAKSAAALHETLERVARDATRPLDVRLEALNVAQHASRTVAPLPAGTFDAVRAGLQPAAPTHVRSMAAAVVERARLDREQLIRLAELLTRAGPLEVTRLLLPFGASEDGAVGHALVTGLLASPARGTLRSDTVRALLTKYPADVLEAARPLLHAMDAANADQARRLEHVLSGIGGGDVRRGQGVFNSPKAACTACHAIGYVGGQLGPDLTRIGEVRTERDLLESILFPSASFARGYEPVTVVMIAGGQTDGVLRRENSEELILVTADSREIQIPRRQIAEVRPGRVSLMPPGLDQVLTRRELADLLAFLKATRRGAQ